MMFKRNVLVVMLATLVIGSNANAKPLGEELQHLITSHPLLKSVRKSMEAADKGRTTAMSGYYPKLTISGDTGAEKITTEGYAPVGGKVDNNSTKTPPVENNLDRRKFTTTVEQNLFAGGRTQKAVEIAEIDYTAAENTVRATTQDVLLEGITAYLQVARYQTLIGIARRNEETTQRQLGMESQRVERGGGIAVDVMQARTRLQIVKERRVFYEQGLRDAVANYHQVFGHAPDLARIEDLDMFLEKLPKSLESAMEQGRAQSPRLLEAMFQSRKAQKHISVEKSGMLPTIDLVATNVKDKNVNASAGRDESSLLMRFSWNLFSGFETKSRSEAAAFQYEALVDREVAVLNRVDETIRVAWNQVINGRERLELLDSAAGIAFDVMQNRKRLRDAGKESAINVLDAEVEYYGVLSNKINAMYDTRVGSYRLLAAAGSLTPELTGLNDGKLTLPVKPLTISIPQLDTVAADTSPAKPVEPQVPSLAEESVDKFVMAWAMAWSTKDIAAYLNAYSSNFMPKNGLSKARWEKQRAQRILAPEFIRVDVSDLKSEPIADGKVQVSFIQRYESNFLAETSPKVLVLALEDGALKILSEQ